jgi:hypothetical protein
MNIGPFHCSGGQSSITFIGNTDQPFAFLDRPMLLPKDGYDVAGCRLSKPTKQQIEIIRNHLSAVAPGEMNHLRYEHRPVRDSVGGG